MALKKIERLDARRQAAGRPPLRCPDAGFDAADRTQLMTTRCRTPARLTRSYRSARTCGRTAYPGAACCSRHVPMRDADGTQRPPTGPPPAGRRESARQRGRPIGQLICPCCTCGLGPGGARVPRRAANARPCAPA